ncbi:hypothetical protein HRbin33_00141 [bacterium HR33]|nr:hypothetical protein HRbin33_00141 [bacterium HR33]
MVAKTGGGASSGAVAAAVLAIAWGMIAGGSYGSRNEPQVLDSGRFTILRGGEIIGSEEFSLRRGRASGGEGFTLATTASYPPRGGGIALSPVVELGPDSLPVLVQFDVFGDGQRRIYARFGQRRLTLRIVRPGGEAAREYPSSGRNWVADDSVFGLYALPPKRAPGPVQLFNPRTERRVAGRLTDRGTGRVLVGGVAHTLQHLVLETENGLRHLWFDSSGRLMKVEIPAAGLTAERVEGVR